MIKKPFDHRHEDADFALSVGSVEIVWIDDVVGEIRLPVVQYGSFGSAGYLCLQLVDKGAQAAARLEIAVTECEVRWPVGPASPVLTRAGSKAPLQEWIANGLIDQRSRPQDDASQTLAPQRERTLRFVNGMPTEGWPISCSEVSRLTSRS